MQSNLAGKKTLPINIGLAYQGFVNDPVPSSIFDAMESGSAKRTFNIGLLLAAFVVGIALAMLVGKLNTGPAETVFNNLPAQQLALSSHNTYASDLVYPVQVNADDIAHLNEWLSYRVGNNLSLEFLDKQGFQLIGANIVPDGAAISTMAIYQNKRKQRVSLFTRYSGGTAELTPSNSAHSHGLNAVHWQKGGNTHALVSQLDAEQLQALYLYLSRQY